jgi:outer membrane protein, multidrug efflux system
VEFAKDEYIAEGSEAGTSAVSKGTARWCNTRRPFKTAFTEVSSALIAHQRVRESREKQESLVAVLEARKRLAYMRYQGGVDTQLNALDADRDLLQAKLDLRQIKLNELLSVVQLYKALGGGWRS